jgi:CrcB protein
MMSGWLTLGIYIEMNNFFLIAIGGALGSMSRYGCQKWIYQHYPHPFPIGTFVVNITGSFLIGLLFGLIEKNNFLSPEWRILLITGFCGGYTTFSTFSFETISLLREGQYLYASLYVLLSVLVGVLAVWAGVFIIKVL